jgi:phage terminase Nu1 subunit (DNA packaging protein)
MIELNGENYLDGREASSLLGVKLPTLYTYVSRGIVRSYKQGIKRQRLYKQAELESLLRLRPSDVDDNLHAVESNATFDTLPSASPSQSLGVCQTAELPQAKDRVPNV